MYSDVIREREELSEQIRALQMLKELAKIYGCVSLLRQRPLLESNTGLILCLPCCR